MAKAIQFTAPQQVQMVDVDVPAPNAGQVAVRMLASSLCNHPELRSYQAVSYTHLRAHET